MFRQPMELDADIRYRRDAIANLRRHSSVPASATATHARPLTRVRRGLGHQLIAVGVRLAGDASPALQPNPAVGRAG